MSRSCLDSQGSVYVVLATDDNCKRKVPWAAGLMAWGIGGAACMLLTVAHPYFSWGRQGALALVKHGVSRTGAFELLKVR